jgi:murein DD-endopeptidase MepM/ murein hydrolase activator NlpD
MPRMRHTLFAWLAKIFGKQPRPSFNKLSGVRTSGRPLMVTNSPSGIKIGLAVVLLGGAVTAFGIAPFAPDIADQPKTRVSEQIALAVASDLSGEPVKPFVQEVRVAKGDSLPTLASRLGVSDSDALDFIRQDVAAKKLLSVKAGKTVSAATDEDGDLMWLRALLAPEDSAARMLHIDRQPDGTFKAQEMIQPYEKRVVMKSGKVQSSLFGATDAAGVPDAVTQQMIDVLASDVDFYNDLRKGDAFQIVYEQLALPSGEVVRAGRLLALEFVNGGRKYQAVWYGAETDRTGTTGAYYTFDGKSLKKAFLRTPVEFTRVSSGFGSRTHPILGYTRQHAGTDFAAPHGTGIRAASDGVVEFAGVQRGYGNVVIIKHQGVYSTLYAHMSAFARGMSRGMKVNQGDVVGYVGATGWATGPHLHYEIHVNGEPVNPQTVALPDAQPISPAQWGNFRQYATDMQRRIGMAAQGTEGLAE